MDKKNLTKKYETGEITIFWQPGKCIHAAVCVKTLPRVYRPDEKPWINPEQATADELAGQIDACPSGALSYELKNRERIIHQTENKMEKPKAAAHSPMMVELEEGKNYAWCACGRSSNQPWCDGSHKGTGITPTVFKATENKKAAMCMCKQSAGAPFCDGTHAGLG